MVFSGDDLTDEPFELFVGGCFSVKGAYDQIMDAGFYDHVEHHFYMVEIGKHVAIDGEPCEDADGSGVELFACVIPGADGFAEVEVVEGVADGCGVFFVDEGHVLEVGGR